MANRKREGMLCVIPSLFVGKNKNNLTNHLAKERFISGDAFNKTRNIGIGEMKVYKKVWKSKTACA